MSRIWVVSDHHFGHANILNFKRHDGTPLRPFASLEEMTETMIARHNEVVLPQDHVYFLGDVAIKKPALKEVIPRLTGHKRLVRGNHDIFKTKEYLAAGFDEIHGVRVFVPNGQQGIPGAILSHIPLHPASVQRWAYNVHGHTHSNFVTKTPMEGDASTDTPQREQDRDPRYICVCVEHTDYRPVLLDDLLRARRT